ncbi:MAG TPA: formyltransferase family protein, partial [Steroidobacter sp.]|nr:formyltransferase family protein [Steroidobacter sp.]
MQGQTDLLSRGVPLTDLLEGRDRTYVGSSAPDFSLNRLYYRSDALRPPLRIGVMIDRARAPQLFMREVLKDVCNCNFARIVCVIENCDPSVNSAHRPTFPARVAATLLNAERRRALFHIAYLRWLDRRYKLQPDPCAEADCRDLFGDARRIEVAPLRQRFVHRFPPEAVDEIKSLELDVILRFGFNIIRGDILQAARYGVWSFHHGDSERYRGGPALLWELIEGNPLSGAVLQRLDESLDAGAVLCSAILATCPRPSVALNRHSVFWSTQHFVIRKLYELHRYGPEHLKARTRRCAV